MKVFENVELEFFNPLEILPENNELVIVILKDRINGNTDITRHLAFTQARIYKTVEPKFNDRCNYYHRSYLLRDIKCWGRIKGEIKYEGDH